MKCRREEKKKNDAQICIRRLDCSYSFSYCHCFKRSLLTLTSVLQRVYFFLFDSYMHALLCLSLHTFFFISHRNEILYMGSRNFNASLFVSRISSQQMSYSYRNQLTSQSTNETYVVIRSKQSKRIVICIHVYTMHVWYII